MNKSHISKYASLGGEFNSHLYNQRNTKSTKATVAFQNWKAFCSAFSLFSKGCVTSILGHYGFLRRQVPRGRSSGDTKADSFLVSLSFLSTVKWVTISPVPRAPIAMMVPGKSHCHDESDHVWILWNREPKWVCLPLNCPCHLFLSRSNERYLYAHWL